MKTKQRVIIAVALVFTSFLSLKAQTTEGEEFWLTFGKAQNLIIPPAIASLDMQIRMVAGNQPATATIYFTNINESVEITINAYEVYTYYLNTSQKFAVYNIATGITDYSIHISSSKPISVYALIGAGGQFDATNVLPVTAIETDYYHISYTASTFSDAYAVVATQNNTFLYHNGELVTPVPLSAGQVYYRTFTDMTGSLITASNPVAFFALHQGAIIDDDGYAYSQLMQQLAPIKTWDRTFFVPVTVMESEIVRIVASQNNTNIIQLTGGTIRTGIPGAQTTLTKLQAGDFIELDITSNGCFIEASNPVGVCSYMKSFNLSNTFYSLPAQVWIPGIKQTIFYTPMSFFRVSFSVSHYALITTSTAKRDQTKVSIGGMPSTDLSGGSWIENTTAEMSFYSMPLSNETTSYIFSNPEGFIVFGYGVGSSNGYRSYYYLAGSAMRELDASFYANDIHFQNLKDTVFCANEIVNFRAELDNMGIEMDSIKWYVNGVKENLPYNQLEWTKTFLPGNYEIKMWVRFENDSIISKADTLKIKNCEVNAAFYKNNVHYLTDTTFCSKDVDFRTDIEGLNTKQDSIKWYIDLVNGTGFIEYVPVRNQKQWSNAFPTGTYLVKMWARLKNDEEIEITGTLQMEILWIKIRNVRY